MRVYICSCGQVERGDDEVELMRNVCDHLRLAHPNRYTEMLDEQPLDNIKRWIKMRIKGRVAV
jgi:predicted small metal-binding protein